MESSDVAACLFFPLPVIQSESSYVVMTIYVVIGPCTFPPQYYCAESVI